MKKKLAVALAVSVVLLCAVYFLFTQSAGTKLAKTKCKGSARCFYGTIESITDGDTLEISGETVRLALVDTPEKWEDDYEAAIDFVCDLCPIGSDVIVDEDDLQISRSHRRIIAVVYCGSRSLNEQLLKARYAELLEDFCKKSEFANEDWAKSYGCE